MDEIDAANEQAEKWLNLHIKAARGVVVDINGTGSCQNQTNHHYTLIQLITYISYKTNL